MVVAALAPIAAVACRGGDGAILCETLRERATVQVFWGVKIFFIMVAASFVFVVLGVVATTNHLVHVIVRTKI